MLDILDHGHMAVKRDSLLLQQVVQPTDMNFWVGDAAIIKMLDALARRVEDRPRFNQPARGTEQRCGCRMAMPGPCGRSATRL